ncbi:MAG: hypothetical protein VXW91_01855, partial [Pseudomonadota bacterium]|nr:hypothetical protein [Pseudomonadota bacterium]
TQETLLMQLSEGEVLGDDFDVDGELEATQAGGLIDAGVGDMPSGEDAQNEESSFIEEDAA